MQYQRVVPARFLQRQGVAVLAWDCRVTPDSLTAGEPVELRLEGSTPWDR